MTPGWDDSSSWLLTFGDFALLLLCLFVVLATTGRQGPQRAEATVSESPAPARLRLVDPIVRPVAHPPRKAKHEDPPLLEVGVPVEFVTSEPSPSPVRTVEADLRAAFGPGGGGVEIVGRERDVTLRLQDTITFPSGSADLRPAAMPLLDRVAGILLSHPEVELEISGHTDEIPIATAAYPSNWELSGARAAAVARHLLAARPAIDPRRITIVGHGAQQPLDPRATSEALARNRRVEIRFLQSLPTVSRTSPRPLPVL